MSKLTDFFSMSKQERTGAWLIALLIVVLLAAAGIERKCSHSDVSPQEAKSMNERVEKAQKSKPKEKLKHNKNKDRKQGKSQNESKKKKKDKKSTAKTTPQKAKTTPKEKSNNQSSNSHQRELQPVPQF